MCAGRREALQHLLLAALSFVARVPAVAPETGVGGAGAEHVFVPQPTSPQPGHPAEGSPIDQVVAHAPVRTRLALALVHVQLAASTCVTRRAHAAVGAHTVQARASVQAGR